MYQSARRTAPPSQRIVQLTAIAALALAATPLAAFASIAPPPVSVGYASVSTIDGTSLWSRRLNSEHPTASTIKMLNALVVRDRVSLDKVITVSKQAAAINDGDVGLRTGQRLTVRQLLNMMLIPSANDAAEALAIGVAGSQSRYVSLMNAKAKQLGLSHTHAADPHGLSRYNHSTPRELTILARKVLADPVLRDIVRKKSVSVPRPGGTSVTYSSTDHLLGSYAGMEGVKTGYTRAAGFCFVGAAKRNGVELVGVVMNAPTLSARFAEMRRLLDWGFAHTHVRTLASPMQTYAVSAETTSPYAPLLARPATTVTRVLLDSVVTSSKVLTPAVLPAVVAPGDQVALLQMSVGTKVIGTVPLFAVEPTGAVEPSTEASRTP